MVRTEQQAAEVGVSGTRHDPLGRLPAFERACLAVAAERLSDPEESAKLLAVWFDGVALLDAAPLGESGASRPGGDTQPRVIAAMTQLATAWLSPRFAGEPRTVSRQRIPSLRPAGKSLRLVELMGKNTEGTLTPDESEEFMRLHDFFEVLQDIVDAALYPSPATS